MSTRQALGASLLNERSLKVYFGSKAGNRGLSGKRAFQNNMLRAFPARPSAKLLLPCAPASGRVGFGGRLCSVLPPLTLSLGTPST